MKKLAIILALSFIVPAATLSLARAAATDSDLAVGDPMTKGYRRPHKRVAKPAATTQSETPKADAASAEKAAEKPAEAGK